MDDVNVEKLSQELFTLIMHLHKKVFNPEEFIKGLPVPPSHCKVIFYLSHKGPNSVSNIAKDLCISKPNMTPIIDKLIESGYVTRYENPNDRRVLMIEVTEKAIEAFRLRKEYMLNSLQKHLGTLTNDDLNALDEIMPEINRILSALK